MSKITEKALKTSLFVATAALIFTTQVFAASFKDVPRNHWAYASISYVGDRGIMISDSNGNFNPNAPIDKFETSKILARAAGFKYTNLSETETTYYNRAYEKNKPLLTGYEKSFKKWNTSSDREIAFLLEKEILVKADLNQFVIKDSKKVEKLRALSKAEASVFVVKLIGKASEAASQSYQSTSKFSDDGAISEIYKPYVYFLKEKGIVSGDASGKFLPNSAITKATFATVLNKSLESAGLTQPAQSQSTSSSSNVASITSISGSFDKNYPQLNAVQLVLSDGKKKIYKLSQYATISVDGYIKTATDLKPGMKLTAVVTSDDELFDIKATSQIDATPAPTQAPFPTQTPLSSSTNSALLSPTQLGIITEIHITRTGSSVAIISDQTNATELFNFAQTSADIYAFRIGDRVSLRHENRLISSISKTTEAPTPTPSPDSQISSVSGFVRSYQAGNLILKVGAIDSQVLREIKVDAATIATNSATGARINPDTLKEGQKITVTLDPKNLNLATAIVLTP